MDLLKQINEWRIIKYKYIDFNQIIQSIFLIQIFKKLCIE